MKLSLVNVILAAAHQEALRLRAAEVDVDHLYLGLLASGGSAARLLGRHGISLASARRAVQDAQSADLASLGVAASAPAPLALDQVPEGDFRATARAKALMEAFDKASDSYGVLIALLREPSGTVRRLVNADGVVPQDLAPALKEGSDDPLAAEAVPVDPHLLPAPARAHRVRHFVSAPVHHVADALADPALLSRWAYDPERTEALAGGETFRTARGKKTMTLRFHHTRRHEDDAEVVTWVQEMLDGPHAGEPLLYDRFEVHPAPGGSEMVRTAGRRTFGLLGRLMAPTTDRFVGWGLLHGGAHLAAAIAEHDAA